MRHWMNTKLGVVSVDSIVAPLEQIRTRLHAHHLHKSERWAEHNRLAMEASEEAERAHALLGKLTELLGSKPA